MDIKRILIVDQQCIYRTGLKHWLNRHYPQARIVAVNSRARAMKVLRSWAPDWLFFDAQLAAAKPDATLSQLLALAPETRLFTLGLCDTRVPHQMLDRNCSIPLLASQLEQPQTQAQFNLTPAQRRVLNGLLAGQINKQIASDLNITEATIKAHLTEIYRKLGVANRTQALAKLHTGLH
ncbi:response regulator transcription factor [Salinibius halmophilus]|uniref:response regulator transcription factor n=1 Tax=Salinibius halmophilus TaxID=1853216 RepID=UPI000E6675C1